MTAGNEERTKESSDEDSDGDWTRRTALKTLGAATGTAGGLGLPIGKSGQAAAASSTESVLTDTEQESGEEWSQQAKLAAGDGDSNDFFGTSVSVSADGTTAIIGASGDEDPNGNEAGSAYVFEGPATQAGSELSAEDIIISIENNFRTDRPENWPEYLLDEAVEQFTTSKSEPNSTYGFANFDLKVTIQNPERFEIQRIRPKYTAPQFDRPYGTETELTRTAPGTYVANETRFQTPTQVGLIGFQVITTVMGAAGSYDSAIVDRQVGQAVDSARSGYPDVKLNSLLVDLADGTTSEIQVNREIPKFTDVCPEIDLLKWTSERCDDPLERQGPTAAMSFSPATIALEDSDGNVTGRVMENGEIVRKNEIPGAIYSGPLEHEFVVAPEDDYTVRATGTEQGNATIKVDRTTYEDGAPFETRIYQNVSVQPGTRLSGEVDQSNLALRQPDNTEETVQPAVEQGTSAAEYASGVDALDSNTYLETFGVAATGGSGNSGDGTTNQNEEDDSGGLSLPGPGITGGLAGLGGGLYWLVRRKTSKDDDEE